MRSKIMATEDDIEVIDEDGDHLINSLVNYYFGILLSCALSIAKYLKICYLLSLIHKVISKLLSVCLTSTAILFSSLFLYLMFYCKTIPLVSITKEVFFQYDSLCNPDTDHKCMIPFTEFDLSPDSRTGQQLIRGQMYKISIDLRLPESEVNWSQGMFMIRIKLFDDNNRIVINVSKPSILRYKSPLMRIVNCIFYWPLLVIRLMDESQTIRVALIEDFVEGSYLNVGPVTHARIEIEARNIQISPPTVLTISAHLTGLKFYMYHFPIISAFGGTCIISLLIYFLFVISYANYPMSDEKDEQFDDQIDVFHEVQETTSDSGLEDHLVEATLNESDSDISSTSIIEETAHIDIHNEDYD